MVDTVQRDNPALPLRETIALFGMLFATIAFSIDAMLPALPRIAADLSPADLNRGQFVITSFVLGMGLGTFFAGPLSDAFGRKRVILAGIALYLAAAFAAAIANDMTALLAARFVQGLGAAGPRVVTLAMIRDMYAGRQMARIMSFVMMVFILFPAVAPSIGAGVIAISGWRGVFLAFVVFGVIAAAWLGLRQPETLAPGDRRPLRWATLHSALVEVLGSRLVVTYIAALTLGFGQMFAFLSTAPQIFGDIYDRADSFPFWFMALALLSGGAAVLNAKLVMTLGMRRLVIAAFGAQFVASAVVLALPPLPAPFDFALFFVYMTLMFFMVGLTFGNLNALAMEPMGHIAGFAASIVGAVATIGAVAVAGPIGQAYDGTILPLVLGVLGCSGVAFLLMLTTRSGEA